MITRHRIKPDLNFKNDCMRCYAGVPVHVTPFDIIVYYIKNDNCSRFNL